MQTIFNSAVRPEEQAPSCASQPSRTHGSNDEPQPPRFSRHQLDNTSHIVSSSPFFQSLHISHGLSSTHHHAPSITILAFSPARLAVSISRLDRQPSVRLWPSSATPTAPSVPPGPHPRRCRANARRLCRSPCHRPGLSRRSLVPVHGRVGVWQRPRGLRPSARVSR